MLLCTKYSTKSSSLIMLEIHKNYIVDENQNPIAVQIPIAEFEKIEEILEDYFLGKMMADEEDAEILSKSEALKYYQGLKESNVGC
ncbi:conserved hypothetical protein [Planktothrix serta PCC 8927]|uniref:Prevent-host-death family protein n=2 Tax=Planktothrix TaxID=54304 RepID=A0A7Z9BPC8_9CYAN|nr:conserved hypothetical protein [Planktothrix serta PCC 8927]